MKYACHDYSQNHSSVMHARRYQGSTTKLTPETLWSWLVARPAQVRHALSNALQRAAGLYFRSILNESGLLCHKIKTQKPSTSVECARWSHCERWAYFVHDNQQLRRLGQSSDSKQEESFAGNADTANTKTLRRLNITKAPMFSKILASPRE